VACWQVYPVVDVKVAIVDGTFTRLTRASWPSRWPVFLPSGRGQEAQSDPAGADHEVESDHPEEYQGDLLGD